MSDFNWNDYDIVKPQATDQATDQGFNWGDHPIVQAASGLQSDGTRPSPLQTDLREAAQGATAGFGDELNGILNAGGRALGVTNLGLVRHLGTGEALKFDTPTLDTQTLLNAYRAGRDSARVDQNADQKINPVRTFVAQGAGMMANPILSGLSPAAAGAAIGLGNSNADLTKGDVGGALKDTAFGAGAGYLADRATEGAGQLVKTVSNKLSNLAENRAVAATGATGVQSLKFNPEAGRGLLDRGIVGFGNSQETIAQKAGEALDASGKKIGDILQNLDEQGASVPQSGIIDSLRARAKALANDPSQFDVSDGLNRLADRLEQSAGDATEALTSDATELPSQTLSAAEQTKRGFQNKVNYNGAPLDNSVNREAASVYQNAVEDQATQINPELATAFEQAKQDYGLLKPIADASERRAATTSQSPPGGFLDTTAAAAGVLVGGNPGAIAAPIARRMFAPRINSSLAVGADKLANIVQNAPHLLGSYAPVLTNAAARGATSLSATDFILQQTDPKYREHMSSLLNNEGQ